ncbi:hypothetical protein CXB51_008044 [Gossypium anomalum]|uniref:DUF7890 domain-containing protein n=1 Tax=Gossypium anomalum TaxID=47600 RepID=A0A8J5YUW5_9ROSI|nr:hypothetical protein CXB51_008044 [Gossypium anomalum]
MLTFVASFIHWVFSDEIALGSNTTASKFINMNGLNKNPYSPIKKHFDDSFPSTKPLLEVKNHKDIKRSNIRVKVKMTREEAVRLLSKCKDGGVLEFKDVTRELVDLPGNRVNIVSPCPDRNIPVLYRIPEEY